MVTISDYYHIYCLVFLRYFLRHNWVHCLFITTLMVWLNSEHCLTSASYYQVHLIAITRYIVGLLLCHDTAKILPMRRKGIIVHYGFTVYGFYWEYCWLRLHQCHWPQCRGADPTLLLGSLPVCLWWHCLLTAGKAVNYTTDHRLG